MLGGREKKVNLSYKTKINDEETAEDNFLLTFLKNFYYDIENRSFLFCFVFPKPQVPHFCGLFVYAAYILLYPDKNSRKLCAFLLNV